MDPIIGGALIGGAASLLGGATSASANRKIAKMNIEAQREFAQHGIRWKVEDARQAGLHPLYALGSQPAAFSPVAIPDSMGPAISEAGQNIGRAVQQLTTPHEKVLQGLAVQGARASAARDAAEAAYFDSLTQRNIQEQVTQTLINATELPDFGTTDPSKHGLGIQPITSNAATDLVNLVAPDQPVRSSADSSVVAGKPAFSRAYEFKPGSVIYIPGSGADPGNTLSEMLESPLGIGILYSLNLKKQGFTKTEQIFDELVMGGIMGKIRRSGRANPNSPGQRAIRSMIHDQPNQPF